MLNNSVKHKKYFLIGFLFLIIIGIFSYFFLFPSKEKGVIYVSGRIEGDEVDVGTKVAGRVKELKVKEGEFLKKNQVIAILDAKDLKARLNQALAAKKSAEAQAEAVLKELNHYKKQLKASKTDRNYLVKQVEAQIKITKATLEKKEADFKRFKKLWQKSVIAQERFERVKEAYTISLARYEVAQKGWLQVKAKDAEIESLKQTIRAKENAYKSALSQIRQAEAVVNEIKSYLEDTIITSPCRGTVIVKIVEPGEVVPAGTPIVTVVDLDALYLKGYVPETQIGKFSLNTPAYIVVDAFPKRRFPAYVGYISQYAEFTPKEVQTKEERVKQVFAVKLYLKENPHYLLKPGMPADGYIKIKTP